MKTILRFLFILLVATFVARAFSIIVYSTSSASSSEGSMREHSALLNARIEDRQLSQTPARPAGGNEHNASLAGGLSELLVTLAKLIGIVLVVLALQKTLNLLKHKRTVRPVMLM